MPAVIHSVGFLVYFSCVVCHRSEVCHSSENIDKVPVLMFVLCIRLRFRRLVALLILFIGYLAWFIWSRGILHEKPREDYGAERNVYKNNSDSEPRTTKDQFLTWHDLNTSAHDKLHKKSKINVKKVFNRENVRSWQLSLADTSVDFMKHSAESKAVLCDQECVRFRDILMNWPQHKPKAVVYYLAKVDRLNLMSDSLKSLYRSFLFRFDYPVIVFHEADSRHLIRWKFRKLVNIRLFLQEVQLGIPAHVNASAVRFDIKCLSRIGYRHMCYFHAKQVYEQPILVGLEYVWRLDDDSMFPAYIIYDLFAFMQRRRLQYGYVKTHLDSYDCTAGLWEAVKRYVKLKHIDSRHFDKWTEPKIFYNNFEISALSLWMSKHYQEYINFIDLLGGIYYYRWGDAPVKSIAVTLFLPENATHLFTDVTYQHGNFFKNETYSSF